VFQRYVLNQSVGWSDELLRLLLVWITFLGGAIAFGRGTHLGMNLIERWLPRRTLRLLNAAVFLLIMVFAAVLLWQGVIATRTAFGQMFTMTNIPVGWQYLAAPTAAAMMLIYGVRNLIERQDPIPTGPGHGHDAEAEVEGF
ncbi:MAG: TRAP transporter small permease, partial [Chloroflexi bacterium]|nr:TRAP transporter small permease [Chloroflexota bacterium]